MCDFKVFAGDSQGDNVCVSADGHSAANLSGIAVVEGFLSLFVTLEFPGVVRELSHHHIVSVVYVHIVERGAVFGLLLFNWVVFDGSQFLPDFPSRYIHVAVLIRSMNTDCLIFR